MANDNKPIWKDYPLYCGNGDYVIEELVNGTWQTRKRFHVLRTPYGGGEVAANDMLCADLKTGYPETTGVTTHSAAYRRYRCQTGSTASQTQVFNFCQDWSYDEWDGEARTLSAPINGHADMRQRLFRSRFGETEEEIEIKALIRPQFSFDYSSDVSASNTAGYLTVTANEDYTIYCGSSWIQNLNTGGTEGEQTFYFYIEPYTGYTDRSTVIKVTFQGYDGNPETIELPLVQRAIVPFFNVYPVHQTVDYTSGTTAFVANTNVPFNVSENASWLELQGITQAGYQAYNVAFNYSANTGDSRQSIISFTYQVDATGGTASVVAVVYQGMKEYAMDIPSGMTLSYLKHKNGSDNSGRKEFIITTDSPQWSVQCTEDWIRYTGYTAYSNNRYLLRFDVDENSGTTSRYADIVYTYIKNSTQETGTKVTHVEQVYEGSGKMFIYYTYDSSAPYNQGKRINEGSFDASYTETQALEIGRTGSGAGTKYNCLVTAVFDEEITEISGRAMGNNNTTTGVSIPDTIVSVSSDAFNNLSGITNIWWNTEAVAPEFYDSDRINLYIGNSVQDIPDSGFTNIDRLYSVSFGTGVQTIGKGAFYNSFNAYATSITIPDYVEEIGEYSFANNSKLSGIVLGSGLETIPSYAFYGYNGPNSINKQVYFGTNITRICTGAFGDGSSSQSIGSTVIHFNGTFAQWQNITIETNWHNFSALLVRCTDGNYYVAPDGSYWQ